MKEHLEDMAREHNRFEQVKHVLKTKFFAVRAKRPSTLIFEEKEPLDMIKSFSQPQPFYRRSGELKLGQSVISNYSRV
jgi:hypothetical protein